MRKIQLNKVDEKIILTNQENLSISINDFDPSDLLAAALAKCTASEVRKRASKHGYDLEDVIVNVELGKNGKDKTSQFTVYLELKGNLTEQEIKKLYKYANKSYIRRTLSNQLEFKTAVYYKEKEVVLDKTKKGLMETSEIKHLPEKKRFEMQVGEYVATVRYSLEDDIYYLVHSEVPYQLRGQGIGKELVEKTFQYIKENDLKAKPICSYIVKVAREVNFEH